MAYVLLSVLNNRVLFWTPDVDEMDMEIQRRKCLFCIGIGKSYLEARENAKANAREIRRMRKYAVNACTLASGMVKCEQPERGYVQAALTTQT